MKAATEEVKNTLEDAGEKISLDGKYISLNRKQLDNMPVLGMFSICINTRIHSTILRLCPIYSSYNTCSKILNSQKKKREDNKATQAKT